MLYLTRNTPFTTSKKWAGRTTNTERNVSWASRGTHSHDVSCFLRQCFVPILNSDGIIFYSLFFVSISSLCLSVDTRFLWIRPGHLWCTLSPGMCRAAFPRLNQSTSLAAPKRLAREWGSLIRPTSQEYILPQVNSAPPPTTVFVWPAVLFDECRVLSFRWPEEFLFSDIVNVRGIEQDGKNSVNKISRMNKWSFSTPLLQFFILLLFW